MRCNVDAGRCRDQAANSPLGAPALKVTFRLKGFCQVNAAEQLSNRPKQLPLASPSHCQRV